jgi:gluconolactonase
MKNWEFEVLDPPYGEVSEGPAWDGTGLLFTRIQQSRIMRYDPGANSVSVWRENTHYTNGLTFDGQGRLYGCMGGSDPDTRRLVRLNPDGTETILADRFEGKRFNIPNDVVADPAGHIWFTDPFYEGAAGPWSKARTYKELDHDSVYRLDPKPDGAYDIQRVTFDTTRPNGLLFSLDYKTLFVAQSGREPEEARQLRAYPVKADLSLGKGEVLHDFGAHRGIDGMRLTTDGKIIATAGWELGGPGPMIYVFSPSGNVLAMHPVPCRRPTNCAFGGDRLSTLYVTTIEGYLLRTETEHTGRALWPPRVPI